MDSPACGRASSRLCHAAGMSFTPARLRIHLRDAKRQPHRCGSVFLVGEGGFEPPKSLTTDLQSAPFGHAGILCIVLIIRRFPLPSGVIPRSRAPRRNRSWQAYRGGPAAAYGKNAHQRREHLTGVPELWMDQQAGAAPKRRSRHLAWLRNPARIISFRRSRSSSSSMV